MADCPRTQRKGPLTAETEPQHYLCVASCFCFQSIKEVIPLIKGAAPWSPMLDLLFFPLHIKLGEDFDLPMEMSANVVRLGRTGYSLDPPTLSMFFLACLPNVILSPSSAELGLGT